VDSASLEDFALDYRNRAAISHCQVPFRPWAARVVRWTRAGL